MSKKILITGGCGFIGSNLSIYLMNGGHSVVSFDNFSRVGSEYLAERIRSNGGTVVRGDIRCQEDLDRLPAADVLIDCSAEPSVLVGSDGADARYLLNVNLLGSLNCFEWARKHNSAVVFLSTSRVYPIAKLFSARYDEEDTRFQYADDRIPGVSKEGVSTEYPLDGARSLYGATKLAAEIILEEYANAYNLPCVINRFGVVAGPWQLGKVDQGVFTYWLANHYFKKPLKYIGFGGKGKQVRDVLHIDDACRLIEMQLGRIEQLRAERFNVGGGLTGSLSLLECTALCRRLTGHDVPITPELTDRPFDLPWYVTDNTAISAAFGWQPQKSPSVILGDTFDWLRQNEAMFSRILNA